ncbi:MAG: lipoate--protein ligase family protein [Tannerella sp.]|jgi:lipoate-protein ligase A|nr:lipoate--protein ligase family protein [Tannerella sp.]
MKLLQSLSDDPAHHCNLEKQLLTAHPSDDGDVLLLYINRPSVIVGRHQQIEAEVDVRYCRRHGIEIVRRISGGGAVYHDYGNINYAFVVDRGATPVMDADFASPIIAALRAVGVDATAGARRELLVGGKKISGTASFVTAGRILFHGTLLHRTDLARLARALNGDPEKRGKHIASVQAEVMNLSEITGDTEPTDEFLRRLIRFLSGYCRTGDARYV